MAAKGEWERWFAVIPVHVDAYSVSEIRNGHTRYEVALQWVERRLVPRLERDDVTDQDEVPEHWEYRLPQP